MAECCELSLRFQTRRELLEKLRVWKFVSKVFSKLGKRSGLSGNDLGSYVRDTRYESWPE
jgi:hypothetical protein